MSCILRLLIIYSSEQCCLLSVIVNCGSVLDCGIMEVQSGLELDKALGHAIGFLDEEVLFLATVELNMKVVTHICHAKDICNTMGVVPNLSRVARQLAHLIGVGPSGIAMNAHVSVGLVHILEERAVGEDIDHRTCVKDDPGGGEVTITLDKLVRVIGDKILCTLH